MPGTGFKPVVRCLTCRGWVRLPLASAISCSYFQYLSVSFASCTNPCTKIQLGSGRIEHPPLIGRVLSPEEDDRVYKGHPVVVLYLLSRYVASQLFGVKSNDVSTPAMALAILVMVALGAGFLPARKASAIDPIQMRWKLF